MSKRGEIVDGVRWDRTEQWECTVWVDKVAVWVGDAMNASDIAEGIRIGRRITTPAREEPK